MALEAQFRRGRAAYSLLELVLVVSILAILGGLVLPTFTRVDTTAQDRVLFDQLRMFRTQTELFKARHNGVSPGYPNYDRSATPTEEAFKDQMVHWTWADGTKATAKKDGAFPPFMEDVPTNPLTGNDKVRVIPDNEAMPEPDGKTYGWSYKPATNQLIPNVPGVDADGRPYAGY